MTEKYYLAPDILAYYERNNEAGRLQSGRGFLGLGIPQPHASMSTGNAPAGQDASVTGTPADHEPPICRAPIGPNEDRPPPPFAKAPLGTSSIDP